MKSYQAYAGGNTATANTPRKAAEKFFSDFPNKRKCSVIEGKVDGAFFVVTYGRASDGKWPASYKEVTKKTAQSLPDVNA